MAFVAIGYFLAPRGFKGESFVELYHKNGITPKKGDKIYLKENKDFVSFIVENFFSYQKGSVLKILEAGTKEEAKNFKEKEFFLNIDYDTDFLGKELLGFSVYDTQRGKIGEVSDFEILEPYILLICKNDKGIFEIPFVKNLGLKIVREEKKLIFSLPEDYPGVDNEN